MALGAEVSGLKEHAKTIHQHQEQVVHHEQLIADLERSERPASSEIEARMADGHDREAQHHAQMRDAHERLKRFHHRAMAQLSVVLKSLNHEV